VLQAIHRLGIIHLFDLRVDLVDAGIDVGYAGKTRSKSVSVAIYFSNKHELLTSRDKVSCRLIRSRSSCHESAILIRSTIVVKKKGVYC
jgi:hypothetical protein